MHVILTMAVCMYAAVNMLGAAQSWHSSPTTALCFSVAAGALMLAVMETDRWLKVSVDSLRYYEKEGLVSPARDPSGRRRYDAAAIATLEVVRLLRDAGIGIDPIRKVIAVKRRGGSSEARLRRVEIVLRSIHADIEERRNGLDVAARTVDAWLEDVRRALR